MKKLIFLLSFATSSICYGAFTTDKLTVTSTFTVTGSTIILNGTTYFWQAGTGSSGQFLQTDGAARPTLTFGTASGSGGSGSVGSTSYGSLYTKNGAANQIEISFSTVTLTFFSNAGISTHAVSNATTDSVTVATTGIFNVYAVFVSSDNAGSSNLYYSICVNGVPSNFSGSFNPINYYIPSSITGILSLNVGDVVTLCGFANESPGIGLSIVDAQLIVSATGGIGGTTIISGGSSTSPLGVFKNGVQVSSPTSQINFSGNYWDITLGGTSTGTVKLIGGNTNYIQVSNTLQSGATAYPEYLSVGSTNAVQETPLNVYSYHNGVSYTPILNIANTGNGGSSASSGGVGFSLKNSSLNNAVFSGIYDSGGSLTAGSETGNLNLLVKNAGTFPVWPQIVIDPNKTTITNRLQGYSDLQLNTIGLFYNIGATEKVIWYHNSGNGTWTYNGDTFTLDKKINFLTGIQASSVTVPGSNGVGVTYGVTAGSVTVNNLTASQFVKTDANKRLSSQAQISLATDVTGTLSAVNFVSTAAYTVSTQTFSGQNTFTNTSNSFSGDGSGLLKISSLTATGVTAGSYTNTNLTVDAQGRITAASNGSAGSGGGSIGSTAYGTLYTSSGAINQTGITTTLTKLSFFSSAGISTHAVSNATTDTITVATTGVFNVYAVFTSTDFFASVNRLRYYICVNDAPSNFSQSFDPSFSATAHFPVPITGILSLNTGDVVSLCGYTDTPTGQGFSISDAQLIVSAVGGIGGTTITSGGTSIYPSSSTAIFPYGFSASTGVFSSTVTASSIGINATPTFALTVSTIGAGTLAAPTDIFLWGGSTAGNPELYVRGRENVGGGMQTGSISIESSSNGSGDSKFLIEAFNTGGNSNNVRIKVPNDGVSHAGVNYHGSGASAVVWKQDAVSGDGYTAVRSALMQEAGASDEEGIFIQEGRSTEIRNLADNIHFVPDGGTMALRSTATTLVSPTSGVGIEWAYDTDDNRQGATGLGSMTTYDRTGSAYKSLRVNGYDFGIYASGIQKVLVNSDAVYIGSGTTALPLRFMEPSGSGVNYTGFVAQAQSANVTYTLPPDDGDAGEQLQTDGSGNLTWEAAGTGGGGGSGTTIRIEDGGSFVVDTSTFDFTGTQFNVTNSGGEGLVALNGSSVTLGGILTAGSGITVTPGTGITTIAATGGSGSSIYPATSTVVFPFGVSATTGVFTSTVSIGQKLGISNTTPAYAIEVGNMSAGFDTAFSAAVGAIVTSNSANVTKFAGENTGADGTGSGSFVGLFQNDGTAVTSGDRMGGFSFGGYDGVDRVRSGASIIAFANGTYSGTAAPSRIDFEVASAASTTRSAKLSVNESSVDILSGTSAQELRLYEPSGSGSNYTGFKAQAQTGNVTYTLPSADGSSNYVLSTNGSGSLSWVAQSAGGGSSVSSFTYTFPASQANLPGANAPYISNSTNAASAGVFFDETSTQTVTWSTVLNNYNGGTLYSDIVFTSSATSGTMNWGVYIECKTPNADALDYDTDSFSTVNSTSVTVGATSGMAMKATTTLTNQDSCANGDTVRMKLERRAQESDTAVGKGRVRFLRLYE